MAVPAVKTCAAATDVRMRLFITYGLPTPEYIILLLIVLCEHLVNLVSESPESEAGFGSEDGDDLILTV